MLCVVQAVVRVGLVSPILKHEHKKRPKPLRRLAPPGAQFWAGSVASLTRPTPEILNSSTNHGFDGARESYFLFVLQFLISSTKSDVHPEAQRSCRARITRFGERLWTVCKAFTSCKMMLPSSSGLLTEKCTSMRKLQSDHLARNQRRLGWRLFARASRRFPASIT